MHLAFVATLNLSLVGNLLIFQHLCPNWSVATVSVVGSVSGVAGGFSLYYGLVWPAVMLASFTCQCCFQAAAHTHARSPASPA